ncbi:SCO0930 family lipoprotein [Streptomyces sp. JJ36]|uniref:SCO0930 family lipoprotein n=1 Tax=Streptomyces sp. JJ36 TaxID=2736645 RepID=UPI001F2BD70D|nr:SCO0930 family lipoprotein [Streptomyces sp. JJ36]MCF6523856.1 hypothetical protein [Streptomyces sp. JJ36]
MENTGTPRTAGRRAVQRWRSAALAGAALATALLTASCGYGDQATGSDDVRPVGDAAAGPGAGSAGGYGSEQAGGAGQAGSDARSGPAKTLTLQNSPELGRVVTDSEGWTLYRFDEDSAQPPASNCTGGCAETWPPVPAEEVSPAAGIKAEDLGRVKRDDGSWQLTLGGWPVYRYAQDAAPGDTTGHGVGGTWNALAPDGGKAGTAQAGEEVPGDAGDAGETAPGGSDPAGSEPAGGGAELRAVQDPTLGRLVRDAEGRTLYRFDKDSAWPMKSDCTGACLETWKPAKPVDKNKIEGVAPKLISTLKRPDGTEQLAIDCWPVYWFTGDRQPGDTTGHGKQGLWWAVTDKGGKAGKAG